MLQVGDIVKVIDNGQSYSTYMEWARRFYLWRYISGATPKMGSIGRIVCVERHLTSGRVLLGILIENNHYIIGVRGVISDNQHISTYVEQMQARRKKLGYKF